MNPDHDPNLEDHDRGLSFDMPKLMSRRRALGQLTGSVGTAVLAACGSSPKDAARTTSAASTAEIPDETAGPYPGDGSNGPNALTESGIVRRDITTSFGEASGVAKGIPTAIEMTLLDVAAGGTPLAGAAVYLWHCNIDGHYSMYDEDIADENYLTRPAATSRAFRTSPRPRCRATTSSATPTPASSQRRRARSTAPSPSS